MLRKGAVVAVRLLKTYLRIGNIVPRFPWNFNHFHESFWNSSVEEYNIAYFDRKTFHPSKSETQENLGYLLDGVILPPDRPVWLALSPLGYKS